MKLSHIMISAVALSAGTAQAQVETLSGASASRDNVALTLNSLCAGGITLFKDGSGTSSPGNIFTAKCPVNFTGTTVNEVRVNVNGGSLNAVLASVAGATQLGYIDAANPPAACLAAAPGAGVMAPIASIRASCGSAGLPVASSLGGYLDVEGSVFAANGLALPPAGLVSTNYKASAFNQAFGVAVSPLLYAAMQEHQTAKGRLPANCAPLNGAGAFQASGLSTPECQPSMSRADYAAMAANGNNQAKKSGANFFIGGTAALASDLGGVTINSPLAGAVGTNFVLCRRPDTSGTQASAQLYFLNRPTGSGTVGGQLLSAGNGVSGDVNIGATYTARTNSASGDVVNCVNSATAYTAGVLSLENNPVGVSNYRFVKINGQVGSEGVAGAAQTAEAIAGRYDFWYETIKFCPNGATGGTCASILDAIDTAVVAGAASPGIFRQTESIYTRGGRATRPIVTKP